MTTDQHSSHQAHLGVAGRMAQAFIHSPLSPLFFLTMLFMGIMGLFFTPRQEDPQISVPMVDIFIQYPGASSQQVSRLAIEPLQRIMKEIPDVEHVYSMAHRGQGLVTVQFEVGEQLEKSIFKVHDKLQSNLDKMPPGVFPPLVKPKGIDDVPVITLTLWSEDVDDGALRTLALDVTQRLKEINHTGQAFIIGGRAEQVLVEIEPERLAGFGISLGQVARTIQTANNETQVGHVEANNTHFTVYTGSFLRNAKDIEQLVIGTYQGSPIYVRDVAKITQGPEPQEERSQFVHYFTGPAYGYQAQHHDPNAKVPTAVVKGAPAVTIAISKKIGTNGVDVANQVLTQVEKLKGALIPDNVHVEVTRNYGKTANDKVNDLIKKLFIATGAVTILVLLSLGLRPAIVVTVVIPVVILVTVFSAWVLGYTIDRVSLFALIFSIGILVDDAIVVIENIYRRWLLKGETDTETAVDAVREVGNPTILATFTVVAALLPMGFVSGMMGPYMEPIPALGSVAMIFSLLAAFMFTPWLAMRIKPSLAALQKAEHHEHRFNEKLERFFRKLLPPLFTSTLKGGLFLLFLIVSFIAALSMFYTKHVEVKMLPLDNKPEFDVFIDMPEGTALLETANLTHLLAEEVLKIPEVIDLQTYVGTSQPFDFNGMVRHYYLRQQPWQADFHIQLKDKKDRKRSSHEIVIDIRRELKKLLAEINSPAKLSMVEMPPGPPVLQSVVAEIYGSDDKTRWEVTKKMTEVFSKTSTLDDADNYMLDPYEVWQFIVDTEKAVRLGISVDLINQNLAMAMGGFKLGDVKPKEGTHLEPTYIVMQVPLAIRSRMSDLYDLPISKPDGGIVPLAELGRFVKVPQEPIYYQKDLRPIEYVVADSVGQYHPDKNEYHLSAPIYGMLEVESALKDYVSPDGVKLMEDGCSKFLNLIPYCNRFLKVSPTSGQTGMEWTGEWTVTYETFRDMGLAFCAAMVLIYILVVWLFGNFIVPAVIMVPIPLTLLGIIPGHWALNAAFTATSMIGWIALAGIIVRNSILLVDYSIHEIQKGTSIQDAVILACKTRTRPILITAFALVGGSGVILFDPIFQGMAISLLFGVLVSTLLTLVVIPLGCISIGPEALCAGSGGTIPLQKINPVREEEFRLPLWLRLWQILFGLLFKIINIATIIFYIVRGIFLLIGSFFSNLWHKLLSFLPQPPSGPQPPSTSSAPPSSPPPPPPVSPSSHQESPPTPPVSREALSSQERASSIIILAPQSTSSLASGASQNTISPELPTVVFVQPSSQAKTIPLPLEHSEPPQKTESSPLSSFSSEQHPEQATSSEMSQAKKTVSTDSLPPEQQVQRSSSLEVSQSYQEPILESSQSEHALPKDSLSSTPEKVPSSVTDFPPPVTDTSPLQQEVRKILEVESYPQQEFSSVFHGETTPTLPKAKPEEVYKEDSDFLSQDGESLMDTESDTQNPGEETNKARQMMSKSSKKKAGPRRGIRLKTDIPTQEDTEKGPESEGGKGSKE